MDDFTDLLDALPSEELYEPTIPPAQPDAKTTLCSLPPELLLSIMEYSKNKDVLALMRANHLLYAVGLRRFYEVAHIVGSKYPFHSDMTAHDDIETLLPMFRNPRFGVLAGLLQNNKHIACLQSLHVISVPSPWDWQHWILCKALRYILENAVILNKIQLPTFSSHQDRQVVVFKDMKIHQNLQSLTTSGFSSCLVESLLSQSNLTTLCIEMECVTMERLEASLKHMSSTLKSLQCKIHLSEREPDKILEQIDCFTPALRRLENLEYGYCGCTSRDHLGQEVLNTHYTRLARNLHQLRRIVINDYGRPVFAAAQIQDEKAIVRSISEANENITEIGITQYLSYYAYKVKNGTTVPWRKAPYTVIGGGSATTASSPWLPFPNPSQDTWGLWFDLFSNPESVSDALHKTFGDFPVPNSFSVEWAFQLYLDQPKSR